MDKMYTSKEVADYFAVPLATVQKWIREKRLVAYRPGKEYRVKESDLRAFESASKSTNEATP